VVRKQFLLMALSFVPIPFRAARRLWVFALLTVLPQPGATATGHERNCQYPADYRNAGFPRVGSHTPIFYRASHSPSSSLRNAGCRSVAAGPERIAGTRDLERRRPGGGKSPAG
jgi:hypothetical protein